MFASLRHVEDKVTVMHVKPKLVLSLAQVTMCINGECELLLLCTVQTCAMQGSCLSPV